MRAIINGLRYDTDKAEAIGTGGSGECCTDFNWYSETLYRTLKSKRYFLAGEGGPLTHYSVSVGNNGRGGGKRITPLDDNEAFAWAQRNLNASEVEAAFGDRIEDA